VAGDGFWAVALVSAAMKSIANEKRMLARLVDCRSAKVFMIVILGAPFGLGTSCVNRCD
jgi:ABC-type tungstate transport system substrate-binding protein